MEFAPAVNPPTGASYAAPPPLDFSKLAPAYQEGTQFGQAQAVHNAFSGPAGSPTGLPLDPNTGLPDFQAAAMKLYQLGAPDQAAALVQAGINQQAFAAARQEIGKPLSAAGAPSAGTSAPASAPTTNNTPGAPSDYHTINDALESGGSPTAHNPDSGPPGTAAYGISGFMPGTWAHLVAAHPELNLPADITKSTLAQQQAASQAYTGENAGYLAQNGVPVTDRTARMANFLGGGGAVHFFHALAQNGGAPAASIFPKEAAANPDSFYMPDGKTPRTLAQLLQYETVTLPQSKGLPPFGAGNSTGFNYQPVPHNQVAGPGAPSGATAYAATGEPVATNAQGQAIDPRTGQPTQALRAPVSRGTSPFGAPATAADVANTATPGSPFFPGTTAATPTAGGQKTAAANASSLANARVAADQSATPSQGDASAPETSYAGNLSRPPNSVVSTGQQGVSAAPSQQGHGTQGVSVQQSGASQDAPVSPKLGLIDPTLGGLVPKDGIQDRMRPRFTKASVLALSSATAKMGEIIKDQADRVMGAVTSSITSRSPALQEYQLNAQTKPDGTLETPAETAARAEGLKATSAASAKANVEATTAGPIAEQQNVGKTLGELPGKLSDSANGAKLQNNTLDEMQNDAERFRMGWGAQSIQDAKSVLQGLSQMVGVQPPDMTNSVGSYQDFLKLAGNISRQASHDTSSRVGVQEMQLINKSLPSPEMSPDGFRLVASQIKGQNDFSIAKQQAAGQWAAQHNNSLAGFEIDWNKNVSPAAFVFARMTKENPVAYHQMVDGMGSQPGGKTVLKNIKSEMTWANQNGLLGE